MADDKNIPEWAIAELKELYEKHGRVWNSTYGKLKPIVEKLGWKPTSQQLYDAIKDVDPVSLITACGKTKRFESFTIGYRFCGKSCVCSTTQRAQTAKKTNMERYGVPSVRMLKEVRDKSKKTMLERYGVEYSGQSKELLTKTRDTMEERYGVRNSGQRPHNIERMKSDNNPKKKEENKEKSRQTMLERYGSEYSFTSPEIMEKIEATMQDRYGVSKPAQNPELFTKIRQTNLDRYGVEFLQQSEEMRQRSRDTMMERYGVANSSQNPDTIEKRKITNRERYGVESPTQTDEVKAKTRKTNMERYGVEHSAQRAIDPESLATLHDAERLGELMAKRSVISAARLLGVHPDTVTQYCNMHNLPRYRSRYEMEILDCLNSYNIPNIMVNARGVIRQLELDFYIPDSNLAIEFNGIYWHSSFYLDSEYHRKKYDFCRERGIRLLMINEDEWLERRSIIEKKILNTLGLSPRIDAQILQLQSIGYVTANDFLEKHHLRGGTKSITYAVGAYHDTELVGVMAFDRKKANCDELIRFCSDGNSYSGMFARMFEHAVKEKDYDEVVGFSDLRYNLGDVYERNGFELVETIAPDYRYVVGYQTESKSSFTKAKIAKRFDIDMTNLTERAAMEMLGIPRLYDCGKLKYRWSRDK